jgi:hypothetical protein
MYLHHKTKYIFYSADKVVTISGIVMNTVLIVLFSQLCKYSSHKGMQALCYAAATFI